MAESDDTGPPALSGEAAAFAESLERRRRAAQGLERDLLTDVPMLYGSPDNWAPEGDPGDAIARLHREELVRRNGGGVPPGSGGSSGSRLPFEALMIGAAVLFGLFRLFARLH